MVKIHGKGGIRQTKSEWITDIFLGEGSEVAISHIDIFHIVVILFLTEVGG